MPDSTIRLLPNATFWVLFFSLSLVALLVFYDILLPFVAGFVLAYLFQPFVDRMSRLGLNRGVAAFIIIAVVALIVALIAALIVPPVIDQLVQLLQEVPRYYQEARAYILQHYGSYLLPLQKQLGGPQASGSGPQTPGARITQDLAPWLISHLQNLLQGSLALFNSLALMFLTPVVTFFLLRDWNEMIAGIEKLLPRQDVPAVKRNRAGDRLDYFRLSQGHAHRAPDRIGLLHGGARRDRPQLWPGHRAWRGAHQLCALSWLHERFSRFRRQWRFRNSGPITQGLALFAESSCSVSLSRATC